MLFRSTGPLALSLLPSGGMIKDWRVIEERRSTARARHEAAAVRALARVRGMVGWLAALLGLAVLGVTPTPASAAPTIVQQQIATSATNTVTSLSVTPTTTTVGN